ncbi:MarR family winged helix-turn-helix transcriptional regulator [Actinomadura flavalba]|uniref:MarR family winged helix-turn-helix transcriptional regulator n=1 Tax=Actinomadura flavalba TaxID=1120938 RepID=UPI00036001E8|nr:MarR family winged helix-turn-helix transcriptional regulator [Actinomadura flavalba]
MSSREPVDPDLLALVMLLGRVAKSLKRPGDGPGPPEFIVRAKEQGLGPRHVPVMVSLTLTGPSAVGEIAGRLGLGAATASQLVGELLRAGLVVREVDPDDRRRAIIDVAPAWQETARAFASTKLAAARTALDGLDAAERRAFLKGLRLFVEASEHTGPPCPDPSAGPS